jgi:hypothetical protein
MGRASWRANLHGDRVMILHTLNRLAMDSPAACARMSRDEAAVEAAASGLSAAVAAESFPHEAILLMGFVAGCFEPDGADEPAASPAMAAAGPAAAAAAGAAAQPLRAAMDALPSFVAGAVKLLADPVDAAEAVTFGVHYLSRLTTCSAVKERAAGWRPAVMTQAAPGSRVAVPGDERLPSSQPSRGVGSA